MAKQKKNNARAKTAKKTPARRSAPKATRTSKKASTGFQLSSLAPSLTVNDLAQSMTWYCDVLGFGVKKRWEHEGTLTGVELQAGPVQVYLSQEDGKQGERVKGQGFRQYWYTNQNIDKIAAAIKSRGGTLASEPKDEWGMRYFNLVDPTGYKITIASNR
jgi:uncharacterized glyoxalase superfamily protein PhnB